MISPKPLVLEDRGIRLEPLSPDHRDGLVQAASDGELWHLWFTSVPEPAAAQTYIADALKGPERRPHAAVGRSRPRHQHHRRQHALSRHRAAIDRVEIGYTWYAQRCQRTNVNTTCKLLLLAHAFDTLGCAVVGLRTDNFNFRSQKAIEALGAKKDGVLRHHQARRDGTVRDSVLYSDSEE